jgi:hypothetical protein
MATPTTRKEFREFCLRKLGKPVIEINVDDQQVDDRVDEALRYFRDYHFDGTEHDYLKHTVTQTDIDNGYVTVGEDVIGVVRIFDVGDALQTNNLFNIRYQIHLNDLYNFTSVNYAPYVMTMMHIQHLEEFFVGKQPIRFNRHTDRIHVDMDWNTVNVGQILIFEVYRYTNPATYADVWADPWLQKYATALIKKQWGSNLSKFTGLQLPGGVQFNGDKILDEASQEVATMEQEVIAGYSLPVSDMIG